MVYIFVVLLLILVFFSIKVLRHRNAPRIFLYHNVSDIEPSIKTNISTFKFEQHILILKKLNFSFHTMNELFEIDHNDINRHAFITFDDGMAELYENVFPILQKYNIKATIYICKSIKGRKLLSQEQIKTMQESGLIEFGSHTLHHMNMPEYSDDIVLKDLKESKKYIEGITNAPCTTFAYPYGKYHKNHLKLLQDSGYKSAVIIGKKLQNYDSIRKYEISRIEPRGNMNKLQFIILLLLGKYKI